MEKISKLQKELDRISSYAQKSDVCTEIGITKHFLSIIKYYILGNIYLNLRDFENSLFFLKKALSFCLKASEKSTATVPYRLLGETYRNMKNYHKALKYNHLHIKEAETYKDYLELQKGYCNIGCLYLDISETLNSNNDEINERFEKKIDASLSFFKKSWDVCENLIKNPENSSDMQHLQMLKADALFNIGNAYLIKGGYDNDFYSKSLDYFTKAREFAHSIGYSLIEGKTYNGTGLTYYNRKNYDLAFKNFLKDEQVCIHEKEYNGLILTYENLGLCCQGKKQFAEAEIYFKKALKTIEEHFPQDLLLRKEVTGKLKKLEADKQLCHKVGYELKGFYRNNDWSLESVNGILNRLINDAEDYSQAKNLFNMTLNKMEGYHKFCGKMLEKPEATAFLHYGAIIEKNCKNYVKAKEFYLKLNEVFGKQQLKTMDYVYYLIDYGNFLDETKSSSKEIKEMEEVYWKAYEIAKFLGDKENMKVALGNLESVYDGMNDMKNKERIRAKLKDFSSKIEEELDYDDDRDDFSIVSLESIDSEEREKEFKFKEESEDNLMVNEELVNEEFLYEENKQKETREVNEIISKTENILNVYSKYCSEHFILELDSLKTQLTQNSISLTNKNLTDDLFRPLLKCISYYKKILAIDLSFNNLSDCTLATLYKQMQKKSELLQNLKILNLSYNHFLNDDHNMEKILELCFQKPNMITSLNLSGINISSKIFWDVMLKSPQLQELKCRDCGLVDSKSFDLNFQNENLHDLDVSTNGFSIASLKFFVFQLKSLSSLNFSDNHGISANLWRNFPGNENVKNLKLKSLKIKNLKEELDSDILEIFGYLEKLDLSCNGEIFLQKCLDSFGDFFFREKLLGNNAKGVLKSLKMRKITNDPGSQNINNLIKSLLKVLIHQTNLLEIDVTENDFSGEEVLEILRYVSPNVVKLKIWGNKITEIQKNDISVFLNHNFRNTEEFEI